MIAADTSALMAILLSEPEADACTAILESEAHVLISAGTVAEAMIVGRRRNLGEEMAALIEDLAFEVVTVTPAAAHRIAAAYERWGKVFIRPGSISEIAFPTKSRKSILADCSMLAAISPRPILKAHCKRQLRRRTYVLQSLLAGLLQL